MRGYAAADRHFRGPHESRSPDGRKTTTEEFRRLPRDRQDRKGAVPGRGSSRVQAITRPDGKPIAHVHSFQISMQGTLRS